MAAGTHTGDHLLISAHEMLLHDQTNIKGQSKDIPSLYGNLHPQVHIVKSV